MALGLQQLKGSILLLFSKHYNDSNRRHHHRSMLLHGWFICALLTILIPFIIFICSRYANTEENDENQNENNQNNENQSSSSPWWFFQMNGNNNNGRDAELSTPPILIATYLWSILVFNGILFYGYHVISTSSDVVQQQQQQQPQLNTNVTTHNSNSNNHFHGIIVALILFTNYNILTLFLLSSGIDGAIETEGRAIDEHGFVGQFGVMMYITSLLWVLFSISFGVIFYRKAKHQNVIKIEIDQSDYESTTSVTGGDYHIHNTKYDNNTTNKKDESRINATV